MSMEQRESVPYNGIVRQVFAEICLILETSFPCRPNVLDDEDPAISEEALVMKYQRKEL